MNAFEASVAVVMRKGTERTRALDLPFRGAGFQIVSFTETHLRPAREAAARYGAGRHPARLNLGGCRACASARHTGERLRYKGADVALTDVASALAWAW